MRLFVSFLAWIVLAFASLNSQAAEIYKYKDESGKWVFSDKKPVDNKKAETLKHRDTQKEAPKPRVFDEASNGQYRLWVDNPYHAPVEIEVRSTIFASGSHWELIPAAESKLLYESTEAIPHYQFKWRLGDPSAEQDQSLYLFPVASKKPHTITQSFKGPFSHFSASNIYAVDIATPIGTYISAAREGTVIWVKDDYHMGGRRQYFLDKANYVKVLHRDGTYAVYAHILLGSALVKPGDKVLAGDKLARAGSSGFSTGPHLHFVIRKNAGLKTVSVPFQFVSSDEKVFTPQRGMTIYGIERGF